MSYILGFEDMEPEQVKILNKIHELAREMESIHNNGKAHYRIALIEELSKEPTAKSYIDEKVRGLFDE